jgi:hypothetical protein
MSVFFERLHEVGFAIGQVIWCLLSQTFKRTFSSLG